MYKRTNIELDTELVKRAMEISNLQTIKEVVHQSLKEFINFNKRKSMLKLKGKIRWEGDLNDMRSI